MFMYEMFCLYSTGTQNPVYYSNDYLKTNLYSQVIGQADNRFLILVCGDVCHESKIFH